MKDILDELQRKAERQRSAFAGWFAELKSAMSYRLWEQGGYRQEDDYVALYESECGLSHEEALRLIAVARSAKAVGYSNGFDAAYPDKLDRLRQSLCALEAGTREEGTR